jgi:hypothetical protein
MPDDFNFDMPAEETLDDDELKVESAEPVEPVEEKKTFRDFMDWIREHIDVPALPRAFWTISSILTLVIVAILLAVMIGVGSNLFQMVNFLNQNLVGSLYSSFVEMVAAHIQTTIPISSEVPAQFDLQLDTLTTVVLSEDVTIKGATVDLKTGGMTITGAPTDIILPKGTNLPIRLVLTVPVDEMIPVEMEVNVDIPINETELHEPFQNLQKTLLPYYVWMWNLPDTFAQMLAGK